MGPRSGNSKRKANQLTGVPVARESEAERLEPKWFDPISATPGGSFIWDDGVHAIRLIERTQRGVNYTLNCGLMFLFSFPKEGMILEASINLPRPTCPECLAHGKSRTRSRPSH